MQTFSLSSVLSSFTLFRSLSQSELEAVARLCESRHYAKGDYLFLQAEPIDYVYFPIQGRVRLFSMSESGKEQTFLIAGNGDMFPHVGFFRSRDFPYYAVALEESHCLAVPVHPFAELLVAHPSIHVKLMQVLADKIIDLQQRL
ncbi:MAG: Crp/Fnr family transcriptional regulator, partial [Paenibacillus sp.]|nr:Crp/Fnr family transcriptional regulator [Paenibacillus sp.]